MNQQEEINDAIRRADLKILEVLHVLATEIIDIRIRATTRIPKEATEA